jgi:hypothetical protein
MKLALDASVQKTAQSEDMRRWLLLEDDVLFRQATLTVGLVELAALANEYAEKDSHFEAAKCTFGRAINTVDGNKICSLYEEALALLEKDGMSTRDAQQLQMDVLERCMMVYMFFRSSEEHSHAKALLEEAGKNPALRKRDPLAEAGEWFC